MLNLLRPAAAGALALLALAAAAPLERTPDTTSAQLVRTAQPASQPASEPAPFTLTPLGSYRTAIFDDSAAQGVAYDAATRRAFVANKAASRIDILDMADPAAPTLVGTIDVAPYGPNPTDVAVHGGVVAVTVEADKKTAKGTLLLADTDGNILADAQVGALPDSLAFTPDGAFLVVANEGEPNSEYDNDPEGSISIIDLRGGPGELGDDDVRTAGFSHLDGAALDPRIRIYGPDASVAEDLEPESVGVSPDGRTAYVTLQENNAIAVVDIESAAVTGVLPLGYAAFDRPRAYGLREYPFADLPIVGTTAAGQQVTLGGFSALTFEGVDEATGALKFLTLTDRGPNAATVDLADDGTEQRPFMLPDYAPRLLRFTVDTTTGTARIVGEIILTNADGAPLTGLSNLAGEHGRANSDEPPVDLRANFLPFDPMGIDSEGVAVADDGSYWIVEEYRPSLLHFDANGRLIRRYVPTGANDNPQGVNVGVETLPAVLMQRRSNRGFEAVVLDGTIIYAFMQSAIDNPDRSDDDNGQASTLVRIVAFDTLTEQTVGQYLYWLDGGDVDKIGDAVALGDGEFLVLERDDLLGPSAQKYIYKVSLEGATNLEDVRESAPVGPNQGLELQSPLGIALAGIRPVQKQLYVDLTAAGYTQADKPEGLALVGPNRVALINDDDFDTSGAFDPDTGLFTYSETYTPSLLTLIDLKPTSLDASDRDGGIHFSSAPVLGMFQPDAIAAYTAEGATYLVTANEGAARDEDAYSEEVRVNELVLDLAHFPNAAVLQRDENLGRLHVSVVGADTDDDGLAERLLAFGTRSFSIWSSDGRLVWDSGDEIEGMTAQLLPAGFNADSVDNTADSRSDDRGPEPAALALGVLGDRTYAFVGLERIGGIIVYDITSPAAPFFVAYANNRDFAGDPAADTAGDLGPESIRFVTAGESPSGVPLLLVANQSSGSTTVYALNPAP